MLSRKGTKRRGQGGKARLTIPSDDQLRTPFIGQDEEKNESEPLVDNEGEEEEGAVEDFVSDSPGVGKGAKPVGEMPPSMIRELRSWNIAIAVVVGIAWAVTLILLLVYRFKCGHELIADLSSDFRIFGGPKPLNLGQFQVAQTVYAVGPTILVPAVVFAFVTMLFHIITLIGSGGGTPTSVFRWYVQYAINNSYNALRWVQYCLTYGMVTWIVAQLAGVSNFLFLGVLLSVKLAIYFSMWAFETTNQRRKTVDWENFLVATFLFVVMWTVILWYFISQTISAGDPIFTNTPWFFFFIIGGALLSCLLGGLIVIIHYAARKRTRNKTAQQSNVNYERWWIIHSMITNVYLCVILIVATITTSP